MRKNLSVLIAGPVSPDAVARLEKSYAVLKGVGLPPEKFRQLLGTAHVLVFRSGIALGADVLGAAGNLRLVIRAGAGVDNIDLDFVRTHGIRFERIPQPGARAVAELSFTFMLALARNLFRLDKLIREGRWAKHEVPAYLLNGKTLGIVGAGNIGTRVGRMGAAWGMSVLGCVKPRTPEIEAELRKNHVEPAEFTDVMTKSDFVSVHVPLDDSTRGMIGLKELRSMRQGSYLVNLARGGIVDESALLRVLREGKPLAGAALDVHENEGEGVVPPLASLPNVILTPHIGAQTVDSQREIGEIIVKLIDEFAAGS